MLKKLRAIIRELMEEQASNAYEKWVNELAHLTPWKWEYISTQKGAWKFTANNGKRTVEVMIPFRFSRKTLKKTITTVQKFFTFVG